METPTTLDDYFALVDDFFKKTFREDSRLFVAIKTTQHSDAAWSPMLWFGPPAPVTESKPPVGPSKEAFTSNHVTFSPRMVLNRDGSALGKVKLSFGQRLPHICDLEQGLLLNTRGVVTVAGKVKELIENVTLSARAIINTLAPASEDVTAVQVNYKRRDGYYSMGYQRNGLGSSNLLLNCGVTFFNLLAAAGFERQRLSYIEQQDEPGEVDALYAGFGFTGVNWTIAGKMLRTRDAWSAGQLALTQRLSPSTMVACNYVYDLPASLAHISIGFTQGFSLHLPPIFHARRRHLPEGGESNAAWSSLPLVGAAKADNSGLCSVTLRGLLNDTVHWGVVLHKNLLKEDSPIRYGLTLSMEAEA